ncbi:MAG: DOMON-like domain-containing protein [Cyanobacteria bacterium J06621_11]
MNAVKAFTLLPFEASPSTKELNITGSLTRKGDILSIAYLLTGNLENVQLPSLRPSNDVSGHRKDRLWEKTCLEFFLTASSQKQNQDPYWEFNLSPTGSWNVFALDSYRQGLREETAFTALPFSMTQTAKELKLDISVDLSAVLPTKTPWTLGVSAVIVLANGTETFWAIAHPKPTADFHSAGSFTATLHS